MLYCLFFENKALLLITLSIGILTTACKSKTVIETMYNEPPPLETILLEEKQVYTYAEQHASFPGGEAALMKYIHENLHYPATTIENAPGRIVFRFIVRSTGKIENVEIMKSLTPEFDKEAIRMFESMPLWIPAKQNGEPVDIYYMMPINIHWKQHSSDRF